MALFDVDEVESRLLASLAASTYRSWRRSSSSSDDQGESGPAVAPVALLSTVRGSSSGSCCARIGRWNEYRPE